MRLVEYGPWLALCHTIHTWRTYMIINKKTVLLALSVVAIVGCGSKKESKSARTNKSAAEIAAQETSPTVSEGVEASDEKNPDGSIADGSFPKLDRSKKLPTEPGDSLVESNEESAFPKAGQDNGKKSDDLKSSKEESAQTKTVSFDQPEAIKTGGQSKDLFYTASSQDGLMTEFRSYNSKVSAGQSKMNASLAKIITSAKIKKSGADMLIDLTTDEQGVLQTYKLKATQVGDKHTIKVVSQTGDLEFQGGFLKCLDKNDSCDNLYIKVKLSGAYTRIIFRTSYANRLFQYQDSSSDGHRLWMTYVNNSTQASSTNQKFKSAQVASFEIVNGRAAMGAVIMTHDNESVGLSFPLVALAQGTEVSAAAVKSQDISKIYNLAAIGATSQRLAQAITAAKLVNNNGLGDVRLKLEFGSTAGIWVVLSRVAQDTATVQDIRNFEAKVKGF